MQWIKAGLALAGLWAGTALGDSQMPDFDDDVALLRSQWETLVLGSGEARIAVVPALQGRIMTSTNGAPGQPSFGWFNRRRLADGILYQGRYAVGGEDRLWFGPEYGPFNLFFPPGAQMTGENVVYPPPMDAEPYPLLEASDTRAVFARDLQLQNYSGKVFDIGVNRAILILSDDEVEAALGVSLDGIRAVGHQSRSTLSNSSEKAWSRDTGLISLWSLGVFPPGPRTVVILPLADEQAEVTQYWSEVDADRLRVKQGVAYYRGDGAHMHKIGLRPELAKPLFGSWDPVNGVLTLVQFNLDPGGTYVNSEWRDDANPYRGDAINVFNDGAFPDTEPFGPFYELESSSSTRELAPGEGILHVHSTFHLQGKRAALERAAEITLGVTLDQIEQIFPASP